MLLWQAGSLPPKWRKEEEEELEVKRLPQRRKEQGFGYPPLLPNSSCVQQYSRTRLSGNPAYKKERRRDSLDVKQLAEEEEKSGNLG